MLISIQIKNVGNNLLERFLENRIAIGESALAIGKNYVRSELWDDLDEFLHELLELVASSDPVCQDVCVIFNIELLNFFADNHRGMKNAINYAELEKYRAEIFY